MGYTTFCYVGVNHNNNIEEFKNELHQYLEKDDNWQRYPTMGLNGEWGKWYDAEADMNVLSKDFPNSVFICLWIGEDYEDNGYSITHKGTSMSFKITSLAINEKIKLIQGLEKDDKAKNELGSKIDDMWDYIEEMRKGLLKSYMSQLQFTDISEAFDFSS